MHSVHGWNQALADRVGVPKKHHATITIAFLSLIAERLSRSRYADVDSFRLANPDLSDKKVLETWYSGDRLRSKLARRSFLLPDKPPGPR